MKDRAIKAQATRNMQQRVFEHMYPPKDIFAICSNGRWTRELWRNPSGHFGWSKWKKIGD